jgi:nitrous oxidase accessory protein NosD
VAYIAQNGIQVSYGATAYVRDNRVTGNDYVPADWTACGLLLYEASGVKASHNDLAGNQKDLCNYGKGGGKYQPGS